MTREVAAVAGSVATAVRMTPALKPTRMAETCLKEVEDIRDHTDW
jgi:hypothetical protein